MKIDAFINRLLAWYKTPDGKRWKKRMTVKLSKCKSYKLLGRALLKLKTDWERQDLLNGLELAAEYLDTYGEIDENGEKWIDLETLGNLTNIGAALSGGV
jgi:hypothetical protein